MIATASPHNVPLLRELGASASFDYRDAGVVEQIRAHLDGCFLAGIVAVGAGTAPESLTGTHRALAGLRPVLARILG